MKFAVIYARQSSGKEENSESIEEQLKNCRELCRQKKYTIRGEFFDANTSGRTYPLIGKGLADHDSRFQKWYAQQTSITKFRQGFSDALEMLCDGDILVVDDTTRIYRPVSGSHLESYVKTYLGDKHVIVQSVKNGTFNPNNFAEEMVDSMQCRVNDQQLSIQKQKSIAAKKNIKQQGINSSGIRSIGFKIISKHKYILDPKMAKVISHIYDEVINYVPYNQIVGEMNEKYQDVFKGRFYSSTLYHILDQPLYCGYARLDDGSLIKSKSVTGEMAVSFDVWKKANDIRRQKQTNVHKARFRSLPFSQLLYCGHCGSKLVTSVDEDMISYHCLVGSIHEHNADCRKARININANKKHFTGLKKALAPILLLAQYKTYEESHKIEQKRVEMASLNAEKEKIKKVISVNNAMVLDGKLRQSTFLNLQQQADNKISKLNEKIVKLQNELSTDYIGAMLSDPFWGDFDTIINDKLPDGEYERLLRDTVKRIDCYEDYIIVQTIYGDFRLNRYMSGRFRHFPKFRYKIISDDKAKPKNILKCKIEITYLYPNKVSEKLIVDFPLMRLMAKQEK